MKTETKKEMQFHIAGWVLFVLCAVFFIFASISNGDILTLLGSLLFLIACLFFLVPLLTTYTNHRR